jgi:uncharacterized membrane protein HdeD (DUF308 family)
MPSKMPEQVRPPKNIEKTYHHPERTTAMPLPNRNDPGDVLPRLETIHAEDLDIVDPILEKAYPFFAGEGVLLFLLGMLTLLVPAIAGTQAFFSLAGGLMIMAGLVKGVRSYFARELPGFLASLTTSVFTLVIGTLLTVYNQDSLINAKVATLLFFILQTITHFIFAGRFHGYPYASGFRLVALSALVMFLFLTLSIKGVDARLPGIFAGTLFMLEGALLFGVSLGLQRMAKGLPYLHPSQHNT